MQELKQEELNNGYDIYQLSVSGDGGVCCSGLLYRQ